MPQVNIKQYRSVCAAASAPQTSSSQAVAPANPRRSFIVLQNNGANPALVQFNNFVKNDGSDLAIPAGSAFIFDQTFSDGTFNGPTGAIYIASVLGTVVAVLEGTLQG